MRHLKSKKEEEEPIITRYNLADTIYAKAQVDCSRGIVNLWLGANVMLEYSYDEALELLTSKEAVAKKQFEEVSFSFLVIYCCVRWGEAKLKSHCFFLIYQQKISEDLTFTRNQIITTEVNMSRIYNWDVRRKRAAAASS